MHVIKTIDTFGNVGGFFTAGIILIGKNKWLSLNFNISTKNLSNIKGSFYLQVASDDGRKRRRWSVFLVVINVRECING